MHELIKLAKQKKENASFEILNTRTTDIQLEQFFVLSAHSPINFSFMQ